MPNLSCALAELLLVLADTVSCTASIIDKTTLSYASIMGLQTSHGIGGQLSMAGFLVL